MSASRKVSRFFVPLLLAAALGLVAGCAAPVDTSKSYSRSVIQGGGVVQEDKLRVAEYLNYYEQKFPEPSSTGVGLDVRVGNWQVPLGEADVWVQIGLQAKSARPEEIAPLNLALVIDCSGSMADAGKMAYVRQSLRVFLQSLAANDRVAVVCYDDRADLLTPSREVGDGGWVARAIDRLAPDGSTNLHAGLMLGFEQVSRHYDAARNNAVILLTDGLANVGVTASGEIAADARQYTERGIQLSTIGLGRDFNDALLSELAKQGQGAYHFIDSPEEMDKVFRRDALGLMAKVATDMSLTLSPGPEARIISLTGQQQAVPAGPVTVPMRDMGVGDSQVLLALVRVTIDGREAPTYPLAIELRYTDVRSGRSEQLANRAAVVVHPLERYDPLVDAEVLRNVTIQRSAEGLREIARLYNERRYDEARVLAGELENELRRVAALTGEEQMLEDAALMREYQETLSRYQPERRDTGDTSGAAPSRFVRGTPTPPVIEVK